MVVLMIKLPLSKRLLKGWRLSSAAWIVFESSSHVSEGVIVQSVPENTHSTVQSGCAVGISVGDGVGQAASEHVPGVN
jgi:hypothetical protein